MPQTLTDGREYRRGIPPPDWTPLWGIASPPIVTGIECDAGTRNRILATSPSGAIGALGWQAIERDAGHGQQEVLTLFRASAQAIPVYLIALRASGAAGAASAYVLEVTPGTSGSLRLLRLSAGTPAALATVSGLLLPAGSW